jgi:hypothetical protein
MIELEDNGIGLSAIHARMRLEVLDEISGSLKRESPL